jgi:hypothetical protein
VQRMRRNVALGVESHGTCAVAMFSLRTRGIHRIVAAERAGALSGSQFIISDGGPGFSGAMER